MSRERTHRATPKDWWETLTREEQKEYLADHPGSKKCLSAKAVKSIPQAQPKVSPEKTRKALIRAKSLALRVEIAKAAIAPPAPLKPLKKPSTPIDRTVQGILDGLSQLRVIERARRDAEAEFRLKTEEEHEELERLVAVRRKVENAINNLIYLLRDAGKHDQANDLQNDAHAILENQKVKTNMISG